MADGSFEDRDELQKIQAAGGQVPGSRQQNMLYGRVHTEHARTRQQFNRQKGVAAGSGEHLVKVGFERVVHMQRLGQGPDTARVSRSVYPASCLPRPIAPRNSCKPGLAPSSSSRYVSTSNRPVGRLLERKEQEIERGRIGDDD